MIRRILLAALTVSALLYGAYLFLHRDIPSAAWRHMFPRGDIVVRRELAVVRPGGGGAGDARLTVRVLLRADVLQITNLDFPVRGAGDRVLFVEAGEAARECWAGAEIVEKETRSNGSVIGWPQAEAVLDDDGCKVFCDEERGQYYVFYEDRRGYEKALMYLTFLSFRETLPELEFTDGARAASGMFGEGGGRALVDWARGREVAVYGPDGGFRGGFYVNEDGRAIRMNCGGRDRVRVLPEGIEGVLTGGGRYRFNCGDSIILDGGDGLRGGYLAVKYYVARAGDDEAFSGAAAWVEGEDGFSESALSRETAYGGRVRRVDEADEEPAEYEFELDDAIDDAVIAVRYATEYPGAMLEMSIDGGEATRIKCGAGGSWDVFGLAEISAARLSAGRHVLTVTGCGIEMELDCFVISRRKALSQ